MALDQITQVRIEPVNALILSIVVLYLGLYLNEKLRFLKDNYIPPAVTGGLICSAVVALVFVASGVEIDFDMGIRDVLLLVFFSTIGLSAKLRTLAAGGKALAVLVVIAAGFLVLQQSTGIGLALLLDAHPGYGLMAGSISFAGGHGTAIAWGAEAEAAGLAGASEIGIAFATFGLVAGGVLGGPIARWLIEKNGLTGPEETAAASDQGPGGDDGGSGDLLNILSAILVLAICVGLGNAVNAYLFEKGVLLPGFLTAMFVGIVITNLSDVLDFRINPKTVDKFGEVSLKGPILLVLMAQMLVITLFVVLIVFRAMGRDYDASVISAGFIGLGLGATPVAIANMDAVTRHFGASQKAFLVVPLVGAFFVDILNAVTIKFFIGVITRWLI
jgi:ESS family glutamate:Na+ symporter